MTGDSGQSSANISNASELLLTDHASVVEHSAVDNRLWLIIAAVVGLGVMLGLGWANHQERTALVALIDRLERRMVANAPHGDLTTEEEKALKVANQSLQLELDSVKRRLETLSAEWASQRNDSKSAVPTITQPGTDSLSDSPALSAESALITLKTGEDSSALAKTTPIINEPAMPGEIGEATKPSVTLSGRWFVNFGTYSEKAGAEALLETVVSALPRAKLYAVKIKNTPMWRIQAQGYASKDAAKSVVADIQARLGITGLWVGEAKPNNTNASNTTETPDKARPGTTSPEASTERPPLSSPAGWFIYVDTYTTEQEARRVTQTIQAAGYTGKIAVEHRDSQLYYRVQVVGLKNRVQGEAAVRTLARENEWPNLQLRRY